MPPRRRACTSRSCSRARSPRMVSEGQSNHADDDVVDPGEPQPPARLRFEQARSSRRPGASRCRAPRGPIRRRLRAGGGKGGPGAVGAIDCASSTVRLRKRRNAVAWNHILRREMRRHAHCVAPGSHGNKSVPGGTDEENDDGCRARNRERRDGESGARSVARRSTWQWARVDRADRAARTAWAAGAARAARRGRREGPDWREWNERDERVTGAGGSAGDPGPRRSGWPRGRGGAGRLGRRSGREGRHRGGGRRRAEGRHGGGGRSRAEG